MLLHYIVEFKDACNLAVGKMRSRGVDSVEEVHTTLIEVTPTDKENFSKEVLIIASLIQEIIKFPLPSKDIYCHHHHLCIP